MRYAKIAVSIVLFNVVNAHANRDVNDYSIFHYTTENGLPQNSVKAIASDKFGFYWLATEGGLVRFDGQHFKVFDNANTGVRSNRFVDIVKDYNTGGLLAATDHWSMLSVEKGRSVLSAKSLQDQFDQANTRLSHPSYFHRTWKLGQDSYFKQDSTLLPIAKDKAILMTRGKVFWFSSGKKIAECPIPKEVGSGRVFNIDQDLYILPPGGKHFEVQKITPGGITSNKLTGDILSQKDASPLVICVNNASGQNFISSGNCLYLVALNPAGDLQTTLLLSGFDFSKKVITAASYDKEHDMLLLGSRADGLYVFKRKYFQIRVIADSASSYNVVQDQVVYNDSSVLTEKGIVFSTGVQKPYFLLKAMAKYSGNKLIKTSKSIWLLSRNTLYRYAPDFTTLIQKWTLGFSAMEFAEIQGELWLGTTDGQLFSIDYTSGKSIPQLICTVQGQVQTIIAYEEHVWIGTDTGLFRLRLSDHKITSLETFRGKTVRSLYPLGKNELWIGTYDAGFYLYQNERIKHFPSDKNNYLNAAHSILEDRKGRLWISTNHGIFLISKKDLLSYNEKSSSIPYYLHFDKEAGFLSNEFNGGSDRTGLKLPNGSFCFSSMKGWVFFDPDNIKETVPDREMIVDRIETGNSEIKATESLRLAHAFDPVTITIATAYFDNPDNLQYDYQLDKGKWISLKSNQVTFNAMSSGNHQLTIRKRTGFGNRYATKTIKIDVDPAWWETWIFRIAIMLLFAVLLWLAFRLRFYLLKKRNKYLEEAVATQTQELKENINALKLSEEQLTKENKFQQRLTNHIAHDIRTPLKYLTFSTKHLYHSIKRKDYPWANDALQIYMASEQIFHFTGRLISYLNVWTVTNQPKEHVDIPLLVEQKFNIFNLAAKERNIELINLVPAAQTIYSHGILIDILLHNLLDNSIKHTIDGTVKVEFSTTGQNAIILLSDTGKGISEEEMREYNKYLNDESRQENQTYTGLGFSIIKNILPLIHARLLLYHNQPKGTVIRLLIQTTAK